MVRLPPEPWASYVDLVTASQALEEAIHAASPAEAAAALLRAADQVRHAADYQAAAGQAARATGLRQWAQQLAVLAAQVRRWPPAVLRQQQPTTLYSLQGVMAGWVRALGPVP